LYRNPDGNKEPDGIENNENLRENVWFWEELISIQDRINNFKFKYFNQLHHMNKHNTNIYQ
jgi:hypothetical protein